VGFIIRTVLPRLRPPVQFEDAAAFVPQLRAEVTAIENSRSRDPSLRAFTVVVGNEGFRARAASPLAAGTCMMEFEFLRPNLALPKLSTATRFTLLAGNEPVARGQVL
ncbi:MAG TPA: hypothetical protein VK996_03480, partial [Ramlibacter sp.]|nr:hypothetical protein [Ramlibacter sp.]